MSLRAKLASLFRRQKLDTDMAEEMRLHLEQRTRENLVRGLSPEEARLAALKKFGGLEQAKEVARDQRGWMWLDHLRRDVRHGWRMIVKAPLLSTVIVLSLGAGVGVNTVIFSWIQSLVFRPMPGVANATRFILVEPKSEAGSFPGGTGASYH